MNEWMNEWQQINEWGCLKITEIPICCRQHIKKSFTRFWETNWEEVFAYCETVVDVLSAGLGNTGVWEVDLIKYERLQDSSMFLSSTNTETNTNTAPPEVQSTPEEHSDLCVYLWIFGIVQRPASQFEIPPLPSLKRAGLFE